MTVNRKYLKIFFLLSLLFSITGTVLYTIVLTRDFDWKKHLFDVSVGTPVAVLIFFCVCILFFFLFPFFRAKKAESDDVPLSFSSPSLFFRISSFLLGAAMLASAGNFIKFMVTVEIAGCMDRVLYFFRIMTTVFALISAACYLRTAFSAKPLGRYEILLTFAPLLWSLLLVVGNYYDKTIRMNSPVRVVDMFVLLFLIFCRLFESRVHMEKPKSELFFSFVFCVILLCPATSLPKIIRLLNGLETWDCMSLCSFVLFFQFPYYISAIYDFLRPTPKKTLFEIESLS